jgi:putative MATE family efflux protein
MDGEKPGDVPAVVGHGQSQTEGVRTLLGDPKKAIIKLSIPMIIAMSIQTVYNLVDALWVSGLGPDALAAVGFFFPFFFILIAIATGIGIGAGAALSRRIGSKDKEGSDNVALHSLIIMVGIGVVLTLLFMPVTRPMFASIGAGQTLDMVVEYSMIVFAASPLLFFLNWATAILRGEGDVKRTMYATSLGSVLNIILDPIFIYTLDMGVAGAAWATAVSILVSVVPFAYWLFMKGDTYTTIRPRFFKYSSEIMGDIMKVGLPATVMQLSMSLSVIILNLIVVGIGGTDGIAVFTTGFRVTMMGILPLLGIATAVVSVTGAAYGAREFGKLSTALTHAIKLGFAIEVVASIVTYILAFPIARLFATGEGGERIVDDLALLLQISAVFYPFVSFGMFSSSMFQGTGKGMYALVVTILRSIIFTVTLAIVLTTIFDLGLAGVWWGVALGNIGGSVVAYSWARYYISKLNGEVEADALAAPLPD